MKKNVLVSVSVLVSFFSATAFAGGGVQNSSLVSPAFTPAEVKTLTSGVSVSTSILPHVPRKHASVELNASVSNRGSGTFSGTVTASVVSAFCDSVVGTVNITGLEAYETQSLTFNPAHFTPQAFGDYQLRYVLSDDSETDTVVSNLFTVTTNEFATDNGLLDGTTSAAAVFGNKFTLVEADSIESVSIAWAHDAPSTEPHDFYVVIYKLDDSDTTLVYKSEDVHTRPHHDLVPPHGEEGGRHAVFETYPVNHKLLEAGDYIFAIEAHTEHTGNVHIGTETNAEGVYYKVETSENDTVVTAVPGSHLLVRVNTTSDIVLSPAVSSKRAGITEPIAIFGPSVEGLLQNSTTGITIIKTGTSPDTIRGITATYFHVEHTEHSGDHPHDEIIIAHPPLEHNTEYTVTVLSGTIVGYEEELVWSFTTAGPLEAVHFSPSKDATDVALAAPVHVVFDRDIPWIGSHLDHGVTITTGSADFPVDSVTIRRHELIIAHQNFTEGTTYTVTISESVIDELESPVSWSFTTTTSSTTAISKITETGVSVYPTITEGNITVVSEPGSLIKIVDLTGRVKATYRAADRQTEIYLGDRAGLYLVVVETSGTVETHKVFLNGLNR